jgi:hypothetical protein
MTSVRAAGNTPKYESYGAFAQSDEFAALFNNTELSSEERFEQGQLRAATRIVDVVLRHCDGRTYDFPSIDTIVDFGCGDGTLGFAICSLLQRRARADGRDSLIRYIGVDSCPDMVVQAQRKLEGLPAGAGAAIVLQGTDDLLENAELVEAVNGHSPEARARAWQTTALLCLSHTWFHILNQDLLIRQINNRRPALVMVDVFHSWDKLVATGLSRDPKENEGTLELGGTELRLGRYEDQELRIANGRIYSLRTQSIEGERKPPEVVRGVFRRDVAEESGRWLFASRQVFLSSDSLRPAPPVRADAPISGAADPARLRRSSGAMTALNNQSDIELAESVLSSVMKAGALTAYSNQLGHQEFAPESGSRKRKSKSGIPPTVPTPGSEGATRKNYLVVREFAHPSGWGDMHCIAFGALSPSADKLNQAYFEAIAELLDEVFVSTGPSARKYEDLRSLLRIYGRGEIAIIQPFDPLRVFARMVPLWQQQKASRLGETFSRINYVLEDPNRWQRSYPTAYGLYHALIDLVSSPVSFPLHALPSYEQADVDSASDTLETAFLKLGCREHRSRSSDQESANGRSGSTSATAQATAGISDAEGFRPFFLVPFYYGSLPLFVLILEAPPHLRMEATDALVYYSMAQNLNRQLHVALPSETILRWDVCKAFAKKAMSTADGDASTMSDVVLTAWKRVVERPIWKSWIVALPSTPLVKVAGTDALNAKLRRTLEDEIAGLLNDEAYQISLWFHVGRFFSDESHEGFIGRGVSARLRSEQLVQIFGEQLPQANAVGDRLLEQSCFQYMGTPGSRIVWLRFLSDQLRPILEYLASAKTNERRESADSAFKTLKRVFCRDRGNTGTQFRFSFSRLLAVAGAHSGMADLFSLSQDLLKQETSTAFGAIMGTYVTANPDPVSDIAFCIAFLSSRSDKEELEQTALGSVTGSTVSADSAGARHLSVHLSFAHGYDSSRQGLNGERFRSLVPKASSCLPGNPRREWTLKVTAQHERNVGLGVTWSLE